MTASSSAPATTASSSALISPAPASKILLVERRLTYGGGLCTREVTLPGFYHNLHSINHFHISETPWFKDLGPRRARHLHHAALRIRPGAS